MVLGKSGDPRKRAKEQTSALRVRIAKPGDAARLKNRWREWVGDFDLVMDALAAGGRELNSSMVLVLSLESVPTGELCGSLIAAPPHRLIRLHLSDQAEEVATQVVKLEGVGVDPKYRGLGGGSLMVLEAIKQFRQASYRWMYGQFDKDRQLTDFYSQLGFNVHPAGEGITFPEEVGIGDFMIQSVPSDQWFEQIL